MSEVVIDPVAAVDPPGVATVRASRPRGSTARWSATRVLFPLCVGWLVFICTAALIKPLLSLTSYQRPVSDAKLPPAWGRFDTLLGTDAYGRSIIIRLLEGARASLTVGVASVGVALVLGLALGATAGYVGGRFDTVVRVLLDSLLAFPPLLLLLALTAVFKPSVSSLTFALATVVTPSFARLARASALAIREEAFVQAARSLGASHVRIVVREVVPNVLISLYSYVFLLIAVVMVAEGSLSFLGQGIQPPRPTWGGMINDGRANLTTDPQLVFIPATAMLLTIMSLNVVGDRLRRGRR